MLIYIINSNWVVGKACEFYSFTNNQSKLLVTINRWNSDALWINSGFITDLHPMLTYCWVVLQWTNSLYVLHCIIGYCTISCSSQRSKSQLQEKKKEESSETLASYAHKRISRIPANWLDRWKQSKPIMTSSWSINDP